MKLHPVADPIDVQIPIIKTLEGDTEEFATAIWEKISCVLIVSILDFRSVSFRIYFELCRDRLTRDVPTYLFDIKHFAADCHNFNVLRKYYSSTTYSKQNTNRRSWQAKSEPQLSRRQVP